MGAGAVWPQHGKNVLDIPEICDCCGIRIDHRKTVPWGREAHLLRHQVGRARVAEVLRILLLEGLHPREEPPSLVTTFCDILQANSDRN